jgi:tetratricopeptide (TPR) repeat protein
VATSYNNIGLVWKTKGEYDKALEFYQQCLDIQLKSFGPEHLDVASTKSNIDEVLKLIGD